jgi:hypothetical protein
MIHSNFFSFVFGAVLTLFVATIAWAQPSVGYSPLQQIIPSDNLPKEVVPQNSNNNLDVYRWNGRYYVAFRTAPSHFASSKTTMYIISTTDFDNWKFEMEIALGTDVREPRFYASKQRLFFMFFKGGKKRFKFEPQGVFQTNFDGQKWAALTEIKTIPLGYVPWRIKQYKDKYYLSSYEGINEYKFKEACALRLFVSDNGQDWSAISDAPQLDHPRAIAEMAFDVDDRGDLWGIARLEFDGAYMMHAKAGQWNQMEYWYSEYKFDSPFIFKHLGDFYMISRRNLSGKFARKPQRYKHNLVDYSFRKKTTALFKLDTCNHTLLHLQDFGTTGDCAFPSVQKISENEYLVFDYSCAIDKRPKNWISGQLGKTNIYWTKITFGTDQKPAIGRYKFVRPQGQFH